MMMTMMRIGISRWAAWGTATATPSEEEDDEDIADDEADDEEEDDGELAVVPQPNPIPGKNV